MTLRVDAAPLARRSRSLPFHSIPGPSPGDRHSQSVRFRPRLCHPQASGGDGGRAWARPPPGGCGVGPAPGSGRWAEQLSREERCRVRTRDGDGGDGRAEAPGVLGTWASDCSPALVVNDGSFQGPPALRGHTLDIPLAWPTPPPPLVTASWRLRSEDTPRRPAELPFPHSDTGTEPALPTTVPASPVAERAPLLASGAVGLPQAVTDSLQS